MHKGGGGGGEISDIGGGGGGGGSEKRHECARRLAVFTGIQVSSRRHILIHSHSQEDLTVLVRAWAGEVGRAAR